MTKIIAFTNHKGGVSKTTSVSSLGYLFAKDGLKVLMIDLDSQANLTYSYIDPMTANNQRCLYNAIRERKNIPQVKIRENLYLVPNGLEMTLVELEMFSTKRREYILKDLLEPIQNKYDVILLDCPPSLNIITVNAIACCNHISIPMTANQLSYLGLKMMMAWIEAQKDINPNIKINDIFLTQYDIRENQTKNIENDLRKEFGNKIMNTVIRRNVSISEAVPQLKSVFEYKPDCNGAIDYKELEKEFFTREQKNKK